MKQINSDKKCVINVAIHKPGLDYLKKQIRLGKTLKENNFDGNYLTWTSFPNQNYNTKNAYNCKAAAFEEALKQGYTKLLWLDGACVVVNPIQPIFDKINQYGYYTIKNWDYTCAQTCSDKSLEYYGISRDTAQTFTEHAGGVIGIDYNNPKGKALLDMFIKSCKEGVCEGSRLHDNQSTDLRFLFHRQCQSAISMSANVLELPPIENWEESFSYNNDIHSKTVGRWMRGLSA
jgi:hypothetical protein